MLGGFQSEADLAASFSDRHVTQAESALDALAAQQFMQTAVASGNPESLQAVLQAFLAVQSSFDNVAIVDTNGNPVARGSDTGTVTNLADREWFQTVMAIKTRYLGTPIYSRGSGAPIVVYAVPFLDSNGDVVALLTGGISLQRLADAMNSANLGHNSQITLVDRRNGGLVLVAPNAQDVLAPFDGPQAATDAVQSGGSVALNARVEGNDTLVAVAPVVGLPWSIVVDQSSDTAFAAIGGMTRTNVMLVIPVILIAALISAWMAMQITNPLLRLKRAAQGLAAGDLSRRLNFTQRDEVGEVGRVFDLMADSLSARAADLESAISSLRHEIEMRGQTEKALEETRDQLEVRVEERTNALSQALERLAFSEQRFRSLIEGSQEGIILSDADGTITYVSPSNERLLGWPPDELIGRNASDITHPEDQSVRQHTRDRVLAAPGSAATDVWRLQRADGVYRWMEVQVTNLLDTPAVNEIVANFRDITERRELEEAMQATLADLKRSNADLEHFAYVASHDLQEPLRMVSNYTQLLARRYQGRLDDDADDFIAYAVEGATRMQQLIEDLLRFSRVGTRGRELEPVGMETVLDRAMFNLQTAIAESSAVVTHDPLPEVLGDESQLTQVLQNLIGNAIKFRGTEAPEVHIGVESQGSLARFCVRDNGIGIDPQFQDRIFVLFQRLHSRAEYPGTGIGLTLCKRIVERHGGEMWVESAVGEGASFYFTLKPTSQVSENRVERAGAA